MRCPGCSRGCRAADVRCKYGRKYFAQINETKTDSPHKWEKIAERGGLAWQLFQISKTAKKALRRGEMTEEQLFSPLSMQERDTLSGLLRRLDQQG